MKNLLWFLTAITLFAIPMAASAQFPKRPAAAAPAQTAPAEAVAPAPPPVVNVAPPTVNVTPQVSLPPATMLDEIKSWLLVMFGGLIAFFQAKGQIKPAAVPLVAPGAATEPTTATGLLKTIQDPGLRAQADQAILTVIRSGIPGMGVTAAAGLIPGVGGLIGQGEPLLRKLVDDAVSARLAANRAASQ